MTHQELLVENFKKVVNWIVDKYPHAIKSSFDRSIEVLSVHHVYHTSYLTISNGVVSYHFGSHGWSSNDSIFYGNSLTWKGDNRNYHRFDMLEEFLLEWPQQKAYVEMTLQPYENLYNFEV